MGQQIERAVQQRLVLALHSRKVEHHRALIDDAEAVGVFLQRFFRLGDPFVHVLRAAQRLQALTDALTVIRAQLVSQQRIDRQIEKVGQFHQHRDLRHALPLLPFAHRRNGYAHRLGQLLLRLSLLLAVKTDMVSNFVFHDRSVPFVFCCALSVTQSAKGNQLPEVELVEIFFN